MKKVLLILFVLAICVLAFPHGVMAAFDDPKTAEVTGTFAGIAELTAGFNPPWTLHRGSSNILPNGITITVDCNEGWQVLAKDLRKGGADQGYMLTADPTPIHPENAFGIRDDTTWYDLTSTDVLMLTGVSQVSTPHSFDIGQVITSNDIGDKTYAITVVFTLTPN